MRWQKAKLFKLKSTGKDALGHKTFEEVEEGYCLIRKAPVHAQDSGTEGNYYKSVRRVFHTASPASDFEGVIALKVGSRRFELENVSKLENGHSMLTVRLDKPEVVTHGSDADGEGVRTD